MKTRHGKLRRHTPAQIDVPEGEVRVLESHHSAEFEMEANTWPFHKICWVAVGRGSLKFSGNAIAIQKDDFLLLPANWLHRFVDKPSEPLTLVIICISEKYLHQNRNSELSQLWKNGLGQNVKGKPRCAKTAFHRSGLIERFRLALREQSNKRPGWTTALKAVADDLIIRFAREHCGAREDHANSSMQTVAGAIEYIDTHLYETLRIEEISERCQLSPRRFTDLFKQQTTKTFSEYLNSKRIEYARERLRETGHILYACYESGFNDLAYFYRVFKKYTGQTPGEYLAEITTR